jgi:transposase
MWYLLRHYFVRVNFLLMNDHTHIAQITRQYLHDVGIQMLLWPPMSSELNPIEHLWDNLHYHQGKCTLKFDPRVLGHLYIRLGTNREAEQAVKGCQH